MTLVFLALLYTAPLSSGDKGLWLSVTAVPVQVFGGLPSRVPPEHAIVLPHRGRASAALGHLADGEPRLDLNGLTPAGPLPRPGWAPLADAPTGRAAGAGWPAPAIPRGPPLAPFAV